MKKKLMSKLEVTIRALNEVADNIEFNLDTYGYIYNDPDCIGRGGMEENDPNKLAIDKAMQGIVADMRREIKFLKEQLKEERAAKKVTINSKRQSKVKRQALRSNR